MRNAATDQLLTLTTSLSEAEDIDLPKTIVELQMQEVAYKAALGATARVVQPSLLDFLR
jgi:flagellar hook-associated protein 3 FlgL